MKIFLSILSTLVLSLTHFPASAEAVKHDLYAYETAMGTQVGAVFGAYPVQQDDELIGADSSVADHVEIHMMIDDNDIMRMREATSVPVAAADGLKLEPKGYHLMLMNLKAPLKKDETIPLTLRFKNSGTVDVVLPVKSRGQD